ncbi:MAG: CBS domain-containing protein [Firmicutes bacterium]|nr:CBS domain-containing protein [Bacillota bacterium]
MPHEKKVRDLMIPVADYSSVSVNNTVKEAITVLRKSFCNLETGECHGHRSVLVFDDENRLVGLLNFRALLLAIEPRFLKFEGGPALFKEGFFTERSKEEAGKKVKDIMQPIDLITVDADDSLLKAVHLMLKHKLGTLPVLEDGMVVGMIRNNEVFNEIAKAVVDEQG